MSFEESKPRSDNYEAELVTVCVLSFNRPRLLDRTLACITKQTHKNLQIIISDDCSSDVNTSKVIKSYAEKDRRIKYYIQKKNLFIFKNLKFLFDKVEGDFIMWCDDDDWYDPTYIQKCLSSLMSDENALTAFSYYLEADEFGEDVDSYPNQIKLLERLTNNNTYLRLLAYLFTYNGYGYYNIYYGLHRKQILSWFDPLKFSFAVDADVGMKIISLGHIALVREHLFKKTVLNQKEYILNISSSLSESSFMEFSRKVYSMLIDPLIRIREYCRILPLNYSFFIIALSPFWVLSIYILSLNRFLIKNLFK